MSGFYPDILEKTFQEYSLFTSTFFTLRASQSHYIGFVTALSQYTNTASWATSSPLQQFWYVNNPGEKKKSIS
jgi:hypothetical protein